MVLLPYPIRLPALTDSQITRVGFKSPEDVVVVSAVRTALTKGRKGGFKDVLADELLSTVLRATIERTGIDPGVVQDICVGNVAGKGGLATPARMAALHAGFPESTSVSTVNRQCSSGLQACVQIASAIQTGLIEIGIGAGVESMTHDYFSRKVTVSERIAKDVAAAEDCKLPMGITSENVATEYGITRTEQDAFSVESHRKAAAAQQAGLFQDEIVPVTVKTEEGQTVVVDQDEGIRPKSTVEGLSRLKPAFSPTGSTTAGNASQISDGAAAVLLMKRKTAQKLGLVILGKYVTAVSVGVPPRVMGVGPAYAIPVALERAGLRLEDVDLFEINEAFASQALYTIKALQIPPEKVNPKGGAIAIGHPLGCTGARQVATLFPELKRTNKNIGVSSMCIGSGMGMAAVWERE
ncbi:3-ketoacyl-CoA thiolase with broad chain length specificity [Apophysomyces sp. BC1034]|nr:3-ketoacyl-CoA thiolase with broad chain length specificity [Apophysomyces sp. BC1015]KAG0176863.1 3-ketoacyl-CoA thiolase with broad chain length specificity [Apophysomyces sp. BC1021]KAG0187172.1 3-ketoacyl-CoA thiolase with broad chain length specificity [Apophysomyces sp. BC1034]